MRSQLDYSTYRFISSNEYIGSVSQTIFTALTFAQFKAGKLAAGPGAGMGFATGGGAYAFVGMSVSYVVNKLITLEVRGISDLGAQEKFKDWFFNFGLTFVAFDGND